MIYPVFCIRDYKGDFWSPKLYQNEASARREFAMMVNEEGTIIHFCPRDFGLFRVGDFDNEQGILVPGLVHCVCNGDEVVGVDYEK